MIKILTLKDTRLDRDEVLSFNQGVVGELCVYPKCIGSRVELGIHSCPNPYCQKLSWSRLQRSKYPSDLHHQQYLSLLLQVISVQPLTAMQNPLL